LAFIVRIHHDARSDECQNNSIYSSKDSMAVPTTTFKRLTIMQLFYTEFHPKDETVWAPEPIWILYSRETSL